MILICWSHRTRESWMSTVMRSLFMLELRKKIFSKVTSTSLHWGPKWCLGSRCFSNINFWCQLMPVFAWASRLGRSPYSFLQWTASRISKRNVEAITLLYPPDRKYKHNTYCIINQFSSSSTATYCNWEYAHFQSAKHVSDFRVCQLVSYVPWTCFCFRFFEIDRIHVCVSTEAIE